MRRAILLAVGTALSVGPMALLASPAAAETKAPAAYKAPRNAFGQPDITGFWSNASLTPLTRPASAGGKAVYTEDEVKKLEAQVVAEVDEGNADTDPDAPAEAPKTTSANVRPEFAAAGGDVGGYNRGWLDPGSHVMRVGGEPRTSILTTPNGQPPRRKDGASRATISRPCCATRSGCVRRPRLRPGGHRWSPGTTGHPGLPTGKAGPPC